jgi:hypothetical protein
LAILLKLGCTWPTWPNRLAHSTREAGVNPTPSLPLTSLLQSPLRHTRPDLTRYRRRRCRHVHGRLLSWPVSTRWVSVPSCRALLLLWLDSVFGTLAHTLGLGTLTGFPLLSCPVSASLAAGRCCPSSASPSPPSRRLSLPPLCWCRRDGRGYNPNARWPATSRCCCGRDVVLAAVALAYFNLIAGRTVMRSHPRCLQVLHHVVVHYKLLPSIFLPHLLWVGGYELVGSCWVAVWSYYCCLLACYDSEAKSSLLCVLYVL